MTKDDYMEFHRLACEKMISITKAKNADYTGLEADPFSNFTRVEALGITDTVRGFLVRMMDKFCRINSFAQKGILEVKDESVEDTLIDLANYSILLAGYIKSQKDKGLAKSTNFKEDYIDPEDTLESWRPEYKIKTLPMYIDKKFTNGR